MTRKREAAFLELVQSESDYIADLSTLQQVNYFTYDCVYVFFFDKNGEDFLSLLFSSSFYYFQKT